MVPATANAGAALFNSPTALPNACGGNGCWTNYLRVTDLDGDDQLDIVTVNMQGLFDVGAGEPLVIYRNDPPGAFDNVSAEALGGHSGQHREVAIGDLDGDGAPDIYAPHADGGVDSLFMNNGDGTFEETMIDIGSQAGAARFGDLDDDGDLDLFLTDSYPDVEAPISPAGHVFLNDGGGTLTELANATPMMLDGIQPIDVDLFDADGDFDLDVLIDTHNGPLALWLNDGAGTFSDASDGLDPPGEGNHYNPAPCDVDGDGDLDFWVENAGLDFRFEQLQINDGSGNFTDETAARVPDNTDDDDNGVVCVDLDYDGDFDAIVVSLFTPHRYQQNAGDGTFTQIAGAIPGPPGGDSSLWAELGDLDNDGRLDMATGAGESGTVDRFFLGSKAQPIDERPPGFRAVEQLSGVAADTAVLVHYGVTDNTVTDEGPRLSRAFVRVVVDGGDPTEIDASFMGGDLFRAELPGQADGSSVEYTVCAIDRAGNEGCADPLTYDIGGAADTSGDATATGADTTDSETDSATGPGTDDTASATGASATGASGTVSAGETGDGSGDTTGTTTGEDDGGGCSCTTDERGVRPALLPVMLLAGIGLRRRRRAHR